MENIENRKKEKNDIPAKKNEKTCTKFEVEENSTERLPEHTLTLTSATMAKGTSSTVPDWCTPHHPS